MGGSRTLTGPSETLQLDSESFGGAGGELDIARKDLDLLVITHRHGSSRPEDHTIDLTSDLVRRDASSRSEHHTIDLRSDVVCLEYLVLTSTDVSKRWKASVTCKSKSFISRKPKSLEYSFRSERDILTFQRFVTGYTPRKRFTTLKGRALEQTMNFGRDLIIDFEGEAQLWEVVLSTPRPPSTPQPPPPADMPTTPPATESDTASSASHAVAPILDGKAVIQPDDNGGEVALTAAKPPPLLVVFGKPNKSFHIIRLDVRQIRCQPQPNSPKKLQLVGRDNNKLKVEMQEFSKKKPWNLCHLRPSVYSEKLGKHEWEQIILDFDTENESQAFERSLLELQLNALGRRPRLPLTHPVQAGDESRPRHQTWRVRGVPTDFDVTKLTDVLQGHPDLQTLRDGVRVQVHTLAPDLRHNQVATVRFSQLPDRLRTLARSDQLTIDIHTLQGAARLAIDQHFHGITVLFSPSTSNHNVDILAVPGLGGHAYGSFVHKGDGHMWLSDSLPQDIPNARVMIYGYESGLQDSTNFAGLDDLAGSLRLEISYLLRSGEQRLILVGHSLGGLLVKEALVQLVESNSEPERDQINRIFGALFFGVPNNGMDIGSLVPMVNNQPSRFLLESLSAITSQVLRLQEKSFATFLGQTALNLFCFYETRLSPTAAKDSAGQWKMSGSPQCLVAPSSATSCLQPSIRSRQSAGLPRTHSELVKFASHDPEYRKVSDVLCRMHQDCMKASSTSSTR